MLIECPCQSGSEPNQDFARTPSHPSGALPPSVNDSFSSSSVRPHPRLPHLAFQKSVPGFAPCAHWLNLSRSFSVHPFPAFIYRLQPKTRACTSTVWPRSLEIVTLGFAVASVLDTYHDSFVLSHRSLAPVHLSRFERIASWRPQSLDCASCQVSGPVHRS